METTAEGTGAQQPVVILDGGSLPDVLDQLIRQTRRTPQVVESLGALPQLGTGDPVPVLLGGPVAGVAQALAEGAEADAALARWRSWAATQLPALEAAGAGVLVLERSQLATQAGAVASRLVAAWGLDTPLVVPVSGAGVGPSALAQVLARALVAEDTQSLTLARMLAKMCDTDDPAHPGAGLARQASGDFATLLTARDRARYEISLITAEQAAATRHHRTALADGKRREALLGAALLQARAAMDAPEAPDDSAAEGT